MLGTTIGLVSLLAFCQRLHGFLFLLINMDMQWFQIYSISCFTFRVKTYLLKGLFTICGISLCLHCRGLSLPSTLSSME